MAEGAAAVWGCGKHRKVDRRGTSYINMPRTDKGGWFVIATGELHLRAFDNAWNGGQARFASQYLRFAFSQLADKDGQYTF
jgi:hypothetical protein